MATQNATRQILSRSFLQQAQDWQRKVGPLASYSQADSQRCLLTCCFVALASSDPVHKREIIASCVSPVPWLFEMRQALRPAEVLRAGRRHSQTRPHP